MRYSELQDDLNARGYAGLINLLIIRGEYYTTGSYASGCKVPSLYPSTDGRTKLGTEMGTGVPLRDFEAVILDKSGNFSERFYRIYPGLGYSLTSQVDYETIRDKLIARAHADGLFPPSAVVVTPNGGESFPRGSSQQLEWSHAGIGGNVKIELYKAGVLYSNLVSSTPNTGSYTWNIPANQTVAGDYKIKVTPADAPAKADQSDSNFSIFDPVLTVVSPNGGEALPRGTANDITWSDTGIGGNVKIELYKAGVLYSNLVSSTPNDGSYAWSTPSDQVCTNDYKIKITPANDPAKADESDNNFSIDNPIYMASMDSDPGWTLTGEWGYGAPAGMTEAYYTPPVPPSGAYSGTAVIGYDLNGTYNPMAGTDWATTPVIDCSDYTGVTLSFRRYLGVYTGDKAYVQVKNGAGTWQTVYQSTSWENSASWNLVTYDISAVADGQPGVQVRFGIGPVTSVYTFCGLYVDDLRVRGTYAPQITSNGTAHSWLADHGITSNQEAADISDPDGDGALTWQEYQAGTDPTNAGSVFCVFDVSFLTSSNCVVWYGTTNSGVVSDFIIYRSTNLLNPNWQPVGTNSRSPSGTNSWWDPNPPQGVSVFYRPALP